MHAHEMHAYEMHAYEMHAHDTKPWGTMIINWGCDA
jgi:hypothetical protein